MNSFWNQLKVSFVDLSKSKLRTGLTSLGILVGVLSVVLLVAFGQGLKNFVVDQLEMLGSNVVYVYPGNVLEGASSPGGGFLGGAKFDERDLKTLSRIKNVKNLVPIFVRRSIVKTNGEEKISDLYATTDGIFKIRDLSPIAGRLFGESDLTRGNKVAVLGPKIARGLFESEKNAVGKYVRISSQRFVVIGVVNEQGGAGMGGPDFDSYVYVPRTSILSLNPSKQIFAFYLQVEDEKKISKVKEWVKRVLVKRYSEDDFTVAEQTEFLEIIDSILRVMNGVLLGIGSVSLLVGGIGIMNIMYMSVNERTKEVGIRRALGATEYDILSLFLIEAIILSLLGGLIGLGLASLIVLLVQPWFPAAINGFSILVALGVSFGIGIFFGVFPAMKAAKRSPIDSIRYE